MLNELKIKYHVPYLTSIRYFSALGVLLSHSTQLLFQGDYQNRIILSFLKVSSALSGPAMACFFILSGFVIYFNYGNDDKPLTRKLLLNFYLTRLIRLYPLWLTILILDFFLWSRANFTTNDYIASLPFYLTMTQTWIYQVTGNFSMNYGFGLGTGVGWSISVEWFFYIIFPLLIILMAKVKNLKTQLFSLIVTLFLYFLLTFLLNNQCFNKNSFGNMFANTLFGPTANLDNWQDSFGRWLVYMNPFLWSFSFLIGILGAKISLLLYQNRTVLQYLRLAKIGSLFFLIFVTINSYVYTISDFLWIFRFGAIYSLPLSIFLITLCVDHFSNRTMLKKQFRKFSLWTSFLGESSYAMYLFHFPIISFLKDWRDPVLASGTFGFLYELIRWFIVLVGIHLFSIAVTSYFDNPCRIFLRKKLVKA